jgi:hypothetical protein
MIAAAILLTNCSTPEERKRQALMDKIEKQTRLPNGALPLDDYARLYADAGKGQVIAVYLLPSVIEKAAAEQCEQLTSLNTSKNVPCVADDVRKVKAGERRWVSDQAQLPFEVAPGCQVITLGYDATRDRLDELSCVGNRLVSY